MIICGLIIITVLLVILYFVYQEKEGYEPERKRN